MTPGTRADSLGGDDRSVSEVVAVVLLIGIVVVGVAAVLLVGSAQFVESQETVEVGQAEQSFVQFAAEATRVATGGTTSQRIDLGLKANGGTLDVENDTGHITVTNIDVANGSKTEVMNTSLGTMVYRSGDTTVGYQGGGVWRSDGTGSVMVSPPEVRYRQQTLTMSIIETRSSGSVYSEVQVRGVRADSRYPDPGTNLTNKISDKIVQIEIESEYYRAWGSFFAQETRAIVQYDDADQRATILFLALPKNFAPDAGVIATSGPGELRLEGNGAYIDSYNSSEGTYADSNTNDGRVEAAGDVVMKGDSEIAGDTRSGKNISVGGSAKIDGNATAGDSVDNGGTITGDVTENASDLVELSPINRLVYDKTDRIQDDNDNDEAAVIQDNELEVDATNDTLDPGRYYLENLNLQGEKLVLNATGGNITIVVRDWMLVEKNGGVNSQIEVEGDGNVRLFMTSRDKTAINVPGGGGAPTDLSEAHLFIERDGAILVDGQESHRFQIYAPDNFAGAIGGSSSEQANVTAAVIAPTGPSGDGQFYVQHSDLYGAVVTGNLTLGQNGKVHFDRALLNQELLLAPNTPRLKYLYVTEYEVRVEDS
jgi:flagellin-like protein